jgi:N-acetylmuramoyl-L-alanine amidase
MRGRIGRLSVWAVSAALVAAGAAWLAPAAGAAVAHTVLPGETLWSIAAASNFTTRALAAYNGLSPYAQVVVGQTILIPTEGEAAVALAGAGGATPTTSASTQASPASSPAATSAPATPAPGQPTPTATQVSSAEIGGIASAHGVSPGLAAGVGWLESGFNNALVSPVGARGVMQIMPSTWDYVQRNLAGYSLDPASARDNVGAGVLYLRHLLNQTGDLQTALASYYQGPSSVRRHGVYPETQRYVQNALALSRRFGGP